MKLKGNACQPGVQLSAWVINGFMTSPPCHQLSITYLKPKGLLCIWEHAYLLRRTLTQSGCLVVEAHVLTILLYGSENWLSETLLQLLNSFLGEISKKLLKLLKCYSNTFASIVIGMQTTRALYLTRKHQFLCKVAANNSSETVSLKTFMSLSDDIDSVYIV